MKDVHAKEIERRDAILRRITGRDMARKESENLRLGAEEFGKKMSEHNNSGRRILLNDFVIQQASDIHPMWDWLDLPAYKQA